MSSAAEWEPVLDFAFRTNGNKRHGQDDGGKDRMISSFLLLHKKLSFEPDCSSSASQRRRLSRWASASRRRRRVTLPTLAVRQLRVELLGEKNHQ